MKTYKYWVDSFRIQDLQQPLKVDDTPANRRDAAIVDALEEAEAQLKVEGKAGTRLVSAFPFGDRVVIVLEAEVCE